MAKKPFKISNYKVKPIYKVTKRIYIVFNNRQFQFTVETV